MARGFELKVEIEGKSYGRLMKALQVLGEEDTPFLRAALWRSGNRYKSEIMARAPSFVRRTVDRGVQRFGSGLKFSAGVDHPAARRFEFGRNPRPYGVSRGVFFRSAGTRGTRAGYVYKGQRPRPYVGVISGAHATGAARPYAEDQLRQAVSDEWDRIGREG